MIQVIIDGIAYEIEDNPNNRKLLMRLAKPPNTETPAENKAWLEDEDLLATRLRDLPLPSRAVCGLAHHDIRFLFQLIQADPQAIGNHQYGCRILGCNIGAGIWCDIDRWVRQYFAPIGTHQFPAELKAKLEARVQGQKCPLRGPAHPYRKRGSEYGVPVAMGCNL